ncbi:MAG: imidazole glycerol phosphate synthase subunit HisH [FCB group bacterium]|nr:imidazole glycerol phosphate synthase subunit HisH [FCB group bacterium]
MRIVIVKYNAGNIRSVQIALERIGMQAVVTDDPRMIREADKVIFPGVGEASSAMRYLKERGLDEVIRGLEQPVLGICLGLQLLCRYSEEGNTNCLGIFETDVKRFPDGYKVPHMGWNTVIDLKGPLFEGIKDGDHAYFVHSYAAVSCECECARTDYVFPFSSGLQYRNFYALQFHPEKSGASGERILNNFIHLEI